MFRKPAPLSDLHKFDGFDSGKPELDSFLFNMAQYNQREGHSRTFVIADADYNVVGYHSLCAGMISRNNTPRQVGGHGAPRDIPVALLARLAVDRKFQRNGLGGALLRNAFNAVVSSAQLVAFRAVMVHALDAEAASFYERYGFKAAKNLERTLLKPVPDIIASLEAAIKSE
jgi:ribosomal protein S18 acetylase RimI-like enzyme